MTVKLLARVALFYLCVFCVVMGTTRAWDYEIVGAVAWGVLCVVLGFLGLYVLKDKNYIYVSTKGKKPRVKGVPAGNEVLFFGKIDSVLGFCVIYGPSETCFPKGPNDPLGLLDAKLAIGHGEAEMVVYKVKRGYRHYHGGGFVETDGGQVAFRLPEKHEPSRFEGRDFEEVYVVL